MSYDFIVWKGWPTEKPSVVWEKLYAGEPVRFVAVLELAPVIEAFRKEFPALEVDEAERVIQGPGFELMLPEGARYAHITCSWGIASDDPDARAIRDKLARVARKWLGAHLYDPQTNHHQEPLDVTREPPLRDDVVPIGAPPPRTHEGPGVGELVRHPKFGEGRVIAVSDDGTKLTIELPSGTKTLLAKFVTRD